MAKSDLVEIEGFNQLNKKLKRLDDKVTRREVLKLQKRWAKPVVKAYSNALPKKSGTLARSVKAATVPARKVGGNPSIVVRPGKKGFYRFMVTEKGVMSGQQIRKGASRKSYKIVTEEARDKAIQQTGPVARKEAVEDTAKYIQKQIDKLSR